jgi:A/G-specific adenine glycosylase
MGPAENSSIIRRRLREWYRSFRRDLPWRATRDPYRLWISEIMLQQTRVAVVIPYYQRFLERFPDLDALAPASESELLACWSGLGYYSRARNLQKAARQMVEAGGFPRAYAAIRELPGVGDYTAAAIASMAFGLPHAAVDGNVTRVLARLTNETGTVTAAATKKRLRQLAAELLDPNDPGGFNQALMELGATLCLPRQPLCLLCPLRRYCQARRQGTERTVPLKRGKKSPIRISKTLLIVERRGKLLLEQRDGFWELPDADQVPVASMTAALGSFRHSITHHRHVFTVAEARIDRAPAGFHWVPKDQLGTLPLSTVTRKALAKVASNS